MKEILHRGVPGVWLCFEPKKLHYFISAYICLPVLLIVHVLVVVVMFVSRRKIRRNKYLMNFCLRSLETSITAEV